MCAAARASHGTKITPQNVSEPFGTCDTGLVFRAFLFLTATLSLLGQTPGTGAQGVAPEWDVKTNLGTLARDAAKLEPLLKQLKPQDWVGRGAPSAYVKQVQSAQFSIEHLIAATQALAQNPERLPLALDAFFEMERMELLITSVRDGVRRYQSPELADALNREFASNSVHKDRLRQYIRELARTREQEYEIVNQEAQRCRGVLTRDPTPAHKTEKRNSR